MWISREKLKQHLEFFSGEIEELSNDNADGNKEASVLLNFNKNKFCGKLSYYIYSCCKQFFDSFVVCSSLIVHLIS